MLLHTESAVLGFVILLVRSFYRGPEQTFPYGLIKTTRVENDFSMLKGGFKYLDSVCNRHQTLCLAPYIISLKTDGNPWAL